MEETSNKEGSYAKTARTSLSKMISIKHLLFDKIEQGSLTILTPHGGEERLGIDLSKFTQDFEDVVEIITKETDPNNSSSTINRKTKKIFIDFDSKEFAMKFKEKKIKFKEEIINISDTVELNEEILNIVIPSFEGKSLNKVIKVIKSTFTELGTIIDMSVLVHPNGTFLTNLAKILFKKNKDAIIPPFLVVENATFNMHYKNSPLVCKYCKAVDHTQTPPAFKFPDTRKEWVPVSNKRKKNFINYYSLENLVNKISTPPPTKIITAQSQETEELISQKNGENLMFEDTNRYNILCDEIDPKVTDKNRDKGFKVPNKSNKERPEIQNMTSLNIIDERNELGIDKSDKK
ncbi:hypothetical protein BB558_007067, partial [Smittium angustum]